MITWDSFERTKTCRTCGKKFKVMSSNWAYKTGKSNYFCSWKCFREDEEIRKERNPRSYYRINAGVK